MREKIEWLETEKEGYAKKSRLTSDDIGWLLDPDTQRNKRFYLAPENPSNIICDTIKEYFNDSLI